MESGPDAIAYVLSSPPLSGVISKVPPARELALPIEDMRTSIFCPILGNGGREHALAWKIKQSQSVKTVYVAPGNGGTSREEGVSNIEIAVDDIEGLSNFALNNSIDLTLCKSNL